NNDGSSDRRAVVKLGLITPVLTLNPRVHNSWEETAPFGAVVAVAEAADRLGYHHITCSEHIAVPAGEVAARRGSRYYDPLATFGYLAARMPIWIGGRTFRSLRRAVELADGWAPFGLKVDVIAAMIKRVSPLPDEFEVVLFPEPMPDPVGDPDGTRAVIAPYIDAGATIL